MNDDDDDIRAKLLARFREIGVSQIEVYYSGYGDSGQLDDITTTPAKVPLREIEFDTITYPWRPGEVIQRNLGEAFEDFIWDEITSRYGGFENNDGGQGELTWDIVNDTINLDHSWNITTTESEPTVTF